MAPPKVPKKPLKLMEKSIERPISKSKKLKKRNYRNYSIYIYKVLKQVTSNRGFFGITSRSMVIMNNFVHDMLERLSSEAGKLVAHSKKRTMGSREVQTAIKLIVPGELGRHALIEGVKAITTYKNNKKEK